MKNTILKVLKSKLLWVAVVAYVLGASAGTTKIVEVPVEKRVEVPVERVVYKEGWQELKGVDDQIMALSGSYITSCGAVMMATADYFTTYDESTLFTVVDKTNVEFKDNNRKLDELVAQRKQLVNQLENN
jgi:hypothetical protein